MFLKFSQDNKFAENCIKKKRPFGKKKEVYLTTFEKIKKPHMNGSWELYAFINHSFEKINYSSSIATSSTAATAIIGRPR